MKRFNPATYDPRADSTLGYAHGGVRTDNPHAVILQVFHPEAAKDAPRLCACGCSDTPRGKGAVFGMGHDARLRGKLARAEAAHCRIVLTDTNHTIIENLQPLDYAERFSTDKLDWRANVAEMADRSKRTPGEEAEREVLKKALGPQVGDTKVIKIGRWEKTGKIVAVYGRDGSTELDFEYVGGDGLVHHAHQDADGKVREVKAS